MPNYGPGTPHPDCYEPDDFYEPSEQVEEMCRDYQAKIDKLEAENAALVAKIERFDDAFAICEDLQAQILALEAENKELRDAAAPVAAMVDYRWTNHPVHGEKNTVWNSKLQRLRAALTKETK